MKLRIPNALHHEVIPGILEQNWEEIERKIELVKPFTKHIHIDLLDGIFAPNKTFFDPAPFAKYTKDMIFEVHMMVDNPLQYVQPFAAAGFTRFIGHIERMPDVTAFVAEAEQLGEVGIALDSPTPITDITISLADVDFVFCMTVKAGYSRQKFDLSLLSKVKALRETYPLLPIEVDGGISDITIEAARDAGATRFVSTGFIFDGKDPQQQYQTLTQLSEVPEPVV